MTEGSIYALANLANINPVWVIIAILWTLVWKGFALWRSAELKQKYWFIAFLFINTLGVLEIIYIFLVAKNYKVEIVEETE